MRSNPTVAFMLAIGVVFTLSMVVACDDDDPTGIIEDAEFLAPLLAGVNEAPNPVVSTGSGRALFDFDEDPDEVRFLVEVENIQNVTLAHIHFGTESQAGPIIVELFNSGGDSVDFTDRDVLAEGTFDADDFTGEGDLVDLDDLLAAMEAGHTYVNVHTTTNVDGEIRDQIEERP